MYKRQSYDSLLASPVFFTNETVIGDGIFSLYPHVLLRETDGKFLYYDPDIQFWQSWLRDSLNEANWNSRDHKYAVRNSRVSGFLSIIKNDKSLDFRFPKMLRSYKTDSLEEPTFVFSGTGWNIRPYNIVLTEFHFSPNRGIFELVLYNHVIDKTVAEGDARYTQYCRCWVKSLK